MEPGALLRASDDETRLLLVAAETAWDRPVPHCPDWDAAGLVRHTGGILGWMAAVVTSRQRVDRRTLGPAPADPADLPPWYLANLDRALDVLGSADPDSATWTFSSSGDRRVAWWCRRLAVEVAIHRWDAEHAANVPGGPLPRPLDGDVAAEGVEEFILEFLPGLVTRAHVEDVAGTLHLHATDGPTEWWIDLDAGASALPRHATADTAVHGTRSDLLLWLTNRGPLPTLERFGSRGTVAGWRQLRR